MESCLSEKKLATLCADKYPVIKETVYVKGEVKEVHDTIIEYGSVTIDTTFDCPPSDTGATIEYAATLDCPPSATIRIRTHSTDTVKIREENTARLDSMKFAMNDTCAVNSQLRADNFDKDTDIDKWKLRAIMSIILNALFILFFVFLWRNGKKTA